MQPQHLPEAGVHWCRTSLCPVYKRVLNPLADVKAPHPLGAATATGVQLDLVK